MPEKIEFEVTYPPRLHTNICSYFGSNKAIIFGRFLSNTLYELLGLPTHFKFCVKGIVLTKTRLEQLLRNLVFEGFPKMSTKMPMIVKNKTGVKTGRHYNLAHTWAQNRKTVLKRCPEAP